MPSYPPFLLLIAQNSFIATSLFLGFALFVTFIAKERCLVITRIFFSLTSNCVFGTSQFKMVVVIEIYIYRLDLDILFVLYRYFDYQARESDDIPLVDPAVFFCSIFLSNICKLVKYI